MAAEVDTRTNTEKTAMVVEQLHELADRIEIGETVMLKAQNGEIQTSGKGKQPPMMTGDWVLQIVYRPSLKPIAKAQLEPMDVLQ